MAFSKGMRKYVLVLMRVAGALICMLSIFIPSMAVSAGIEHQVSSSPENFYDLMNQQSWGPITVAGLVFILGAFLSLFFDGARYLLAVGLIALLSSTFIFWPCLDSGATPEIGILVPIFGTSLCFSEPIVRKFHERPVVAD